MEPSELELSYIAGFVDGEGTITIHHRNVETKNNWYRISVSVANTNYAMPYRLKELFGGCVSIQSRDPMRKDVYIWSVTSHKAVRFIQAIIPYLRQKQNRLNSRWNFRKLYTTVTG